MKLKQLLLKETEQLKFDYIDRCLEYASKEWDRIREDVKNRKEFIRKFSHGFCATDEQIENYNKMIIEAGYVEYSKDGYIDMNGRLSKNASAKFLADNVKIYNHQVMHHNQKDYIERAFKQAEKHYFNSIDRLSNRIQKKQLNESNLTLKTSYIDKNISTTISDGKKTVRAYTILAWGNVQKPHYRYLVK